MFDSLGMVCTIGCVHTILRDGRDQFKMGSPGAYFARELTVETMKVNSRFRPTADIAPIQMAAW